MRGTILIVEDELDIAEVLRMVLEAEGYQVETARNGKEGLAKMSEIRPDLVVLDIMMPVLDGREMCKEMRKDPANRNVRVLLMSAGRDAVPREECRWDVFLPKPFLLDEFLGVVEDLLEREHIRREREPGLSPGTPS